MKNFLMVVLGFAFAIAVVVSNNHYHYLDGPTQALQEIIMPELVHNDG